MRVKRSNCMVDMKTAYKIANDFFLENNYVGVYETRETSDKWLFLGKCENTCYGTSEVCVPKNGDEPYLFSITDEMFFDIWENAKVVLV